MTLDIEGVLAGHPQENARPKHHDGDPWKYDGTYVCACGEEFKAAPGIGGAFRGHRAHVAAVLREQIAAAIEAEADRAHAAFASDEDDRLADMRNRLGIDLEPGHWNRHDDGCSMCGMAGAARIVLATQVAPSRVPGEGS